MTVDIATLAIRIDSLEAQSARRDLDQLTDASGRAEESAGGATDAFSALGSALKVLGIVAVAQQFIQAADAMSQMDARLKLATTSSKEFLKAQKDVYAIAQANNVGLIESATLYTKLAEPVRNLGGSAKETRAIVDAFSTTLRISGASAEEASAATLQFAQAMASGKLSGDEFRSMAETSPRFMKAVAEGMGVGTGALKNMAGEGRLTADVVGNNLIKSLEKLKKEAATIPDTVGGAFTRLENDVLSMVGKINDNSKVTGGAAGMLETVRALIPVVEGELTGAFQSVGTFIEGNKEQIDESWTLVKQLVADVWGLAKAAASVAAFLFDWTEQGNAVVSSLRIARLFLASFEDGVKVIGAGFALIGSLLMEGIVFPLQAVLSVSAKVAGLFDDELEAKITGLNTSITEFTLAGEKYADQVADEFGRGENAVARLGTEMLSITSKTNAARAAASAAAGAFSTLNPVKGQLTEEQKAAIKKETEAYQGLAAAIKAKTAENILEGIVGISLTESQKIRIKLDQDLATGKLVLSAASQANVRALLDEQGASEALLKSRKADLEWAKVSGNANADNIEALMASTAQLRADTLAQQDHNDRIGLSKIAIVDLDAKRLEHLATLKDESAELAELIDWTGGMSEAYRNQAAALRERAAAMRVGAKKEENVDVTQAKELLDIMTAIDAATRSAAQGMADSFGAVGSAIGGLTTALSGYGKVQAAIAAELAVAKRSSNGDVDKIAKAEIAAARSSAQARVKSYGDMAGAAKGFFKENTTGYKVLEGVEKGFRAVEMAMAIQSMLTKSSLLTAFTGIFAGSKATEVGIDTSATAISVANSGVRAAADGTAAVAKTASSVPYPYNIAAVASIIALLAGAGVAMGGGGGAAPAFDLKAHQAKQGTGTVLGDDTAKSNSVANSIEMLAENSRIELGFQSGMLMALRNIESSLGGAAKGIFQTAGLTGGSAFGTVNSSSSNFFGSDTSTTIADSGVRFSGSLGQLRAGQGTGSQYEMVNKYDDGGWFHGDRNWTETNTKALSTTMQKQFGLIFDNMGDLLVTAGVQLGSDATFLTNSINQMVIDFEVSTRGLKGQDLVDALSAGISVAFDQVATNIFPMITAFQKVGEGMGETLMRVAAGTEVAKNALDKMGLAMAPLADLVNKNGDVAAELIRQAIMGRETSQAGQLVTTITPVERFLPGSSTGGPRRGPRDEDYGFYMDDGAGGGSFDPGHMVTEFITKTVLVGEKLTGIGEIMKTLSGSADELVETYTALRAVQTSLKSVGIDQAAVTRDLIKGAGDLSTLQSSLDTYFESYFSEAEQTVARTAAMTAQFTALGLTMPTSIAGFRSLVEGIPLATAAGQQLLGSVLNLAEGFAELQGSVGRTAEDYVNAFSSAQGALRDASRNIGDIVAGLGNQLASAVAATQSARDAVSQAYFSAQDAEAAARKKVTDLTRQSDLALMAFGGTIRDFLSSIRGGQAGSAGLESLKAQFSATAVLAQGGDTKAQGSLLGIAGKLIEAERARSRSASEFAAGEAKVRIALANIANSIDDKEIAPTKSPLEIAQEELVVAQGKTLEYQALAYLVGASTDRSAFAIAGSTSALLAAFNKAASAEDVARVNYNTALTLTTGLVTTTSTALTGLLNGLEDLAEAQSEFETARDDLADLIIDLGLESGNLDEFITNLTGNLGLTGTAADALKTALENPVERLGALATLLGTGAVLPTALSATGALAIALGSAGALPTALGATGALATALGTGGTLAAALGTGGVLAGSLGVSGALVSLLSATGVLGTGLGAAGSVAIGLSSTGVLATALGASGAVTTLLGTNGALATAITAISGSDGALAAVSAALKGTGTKADDLAKQLDPMHAGGAAQKLASGLGLLGTAVTTLEQLLLSFRLPTQQTPVVPSAPTPVPPNIGNSVGGMGPGTIPGSVVPVDPGPGPGFDISDLMTPAGELTAYQKTVSSIYLDVLKRSPDAGGLNFWASALEAGTITSANASRMIAESAANADLSSVGKAAGWSLSQAIADDAAGTAWLRAKGIPGFAVGTNSVPADMLAMIHKDERIIPAADNRELMSRMKGGADRDALAAELRELRQEVGRLRADQRTGHAAIVGATNKQTGLLYDLSDQGRAIYTTPAT